MNKCKNPICGHNEKEHDGRTSTFCSDANKDNFCRVINCGCEKFELEIKLVILDNNELSISEYAKEYPENWKAMTEKVGWGKQIEFFHPDKRKWIIWKPKFKTEKQLLDYWNQQPSSNKLQYRIIECSGEGK